MSGIASATWFGSRRWWLGKIVRFKLHGYCVAARSFKIATCRKSDICQAYVHFAVRIFYDGDSHFEGISIAVSVFLQVKANIALIIARLKRGAP